MTQVQERYRTCSLEGTPGVKIIVYKQKQFKNIFRLFQLFSHFMKLSVTRYLRIGMRIFVHTQKLYFEVKNNHS